MANKATFTPEEWKQVLGSVFMAGFAITAADPCGLWGLFKETFASGRALMEAKTDQAASELSKAIVSDMETSEGRSAAQEFVKAACRAPSVKTSSSAPSMFCLHRRSQLGTKKGQSRSGQHVVVVSGMIDDQITLRILNSSLKSWRNSLT